MKTNKIRYFVVVLFALLAMVGCETTVEFKGEYVEPQAVLNSVVSPDEPVRVFYTSSVFILEEYIPHTTHIEGATVELYINGELVDTLTPAHDDNQWYERRDFYQSTVTPSPADVVTIRARSDEFPEWVSATVTVPYDIVVGELEVTEEGIDDSGYHYGTASLELSDPEGVENYYWILGHTLYREGEEGDYPAWGRHFSYTDVAFTEGKVEGVLDELLGASYGRYMLFNDTLLEGQKEYPLSMEWDFYKYSHQYDVLFEVRCYQMDENLNKYLRSLALADNDMGMFSEPVQIYSNVEGGIGIVGARSRLVVLQKLYSELGE